MSDVHNSEQGVWSLFESFMSLIAESENFLERSIEHLYCRQLSNPTFRKTFRSRYLDKFVNVVNRDSFGKTPKVVFRRVIIDSNLQILFTYGYTDYIGIERVRRSRQSDSSLRSVTSLCLQWPSTSWYRGFS